MFLNPLFTGTAARGSTLWLLDSEPMRAAIRRWGSAQESGLFATRGRKGQLLGCASHEGGGVSTLVTLGVSTLRGITVLPDAEREVLGYYQPTGEAMADLLPDQEHPQVRAPESSTQATAQSGFALCFLNCVDANVDGLCLSTCLSCGSGVVPMCPLCVACSSSMGMECAVQCA